MIQISTLRHQLTYASIYSLLYLLSHQAFSNPAGPNYYAYGEIRGHVEPCGCDPQTDLGGISRIAAYINGARQPEDLILSLGNNVPHKPSPRSLTAIIRFEAALKPTAILWNHLEAQNQAAISDTLKTYKLKLPYILSAPASKRPPLARFAISYKNIMILGFNGAHSAYHPKLQKLWHSKAAKAHQRILLYSGDETSLKAIQAQGFFTTIISANPLSLKAEPSKDEVIEPGRLMRTAGVYMVPSFGQGLLRALKAPPPQLNLETGRLQGTPIKGLAISQSPFIWLKRSFADPNSLKDILNDYNNTALKAFHSIAQTKSGYGKERPFAGAAVCAGCHPQAMKAWQNSAHATALHTLEQKQKAFDPKCVTCHVVAYEHPGGFGSLELTPELAHVQCESCHGAAKAHSQAPLAVKPTMAQAFSSCASCHNPTHSPAFDQMRYWEKIRH